MKKLVNFTMALVLMFSLGITSANAIGFLFALPYRGMQGRPPYIPKAKVRGCTAHLIKIEAIVEQGNKW